MASRTSERLVEQASMRPLGLQTSKGSGLIRVAAAASLRDNALVLSAYAVVGLIVAATAESSIDGLIWFAYGIAFALALSQGYHVLPGTFLGAFLLHLLVEAPTSSNPWVLGFGDGLSDVLAIAISGFALRRFSDSGYFETAPNAARYGFLAGLVGPLLGAVALVVLFEVPSGVRVVSIPWDILMSTLQHGLGSIAVAPAVLAWFGKERWPSSRMVEFLIFLLLLVFGVAYMMELFPEEFYFDLHLFAVTPLLIWPAFRLGRFPTFLAISITSLIASIATMSSTGHFVSQFHRGLEHASGAVVHQQLLFEVHSFLLIVGVTLVAIVGVLSERRSAELKLLEEHALLNRRVRERTEELELESKINASLARLSQAVVSADLSPQAFAREILRVARELTNSQNGFVARVDCDSGETVAYVDGDTAANCRVEGDGGMFEFRLQGPSQDCGGIIGQVIESQQVFIGNSSQAENWALNLPGGHIPLESVLCIPLQLGGSPVGAIALANSIRPYTEPDVQTVRRIGELWILDGEKRRSLDLLQHRRQQLEEIVAARTSELTEANAALSMEIEDRLKAQRSLDERLRFFTLLSQIASPFVHLPAANIDGEIVRALKRIVEYAEADLGAIFEFDDTREKLTRKYAYAPLEPEAKLINELAYSLFPFAVGRMRRGEFIDIPDLASLPPEAEPEKVFLQQRTRRAVICIPLGLGGSSVGSAILAWDVPRAPLDENAVRRFELLGATLSHALIRKRSHQQLERSSALNAGILNSLSDQVAVLNPEGIIIAVNKAWGEFAIGNGADQATQAGIGLNYLEVCRNATGAECNEAAAAESLLRHVLNGREERGTVEYRCDSPSAKRQFIMTVTRLRLPENGAVIQHTEMTELRRVEAELRQRQEELAHIGRISAMGELAASLAHELNQPLTALVANCSALQNFSARGTIPADELEGALKDIVRDARRAGEIIQRLRNFIRSGESKFERLNLGRVIEGLNLFLRADADRCRTRIDIHLAPEVPEIIGDRLQLELVLLNLVRNALEAVSDLPAGNRVIRLSLQRTEEDGILCSLCNLGTPVSEFVLDRLFDPFFTTKKEGTGIGLSLSRSIIENHKGVLTAAANPEGGLTVGFSLPGADSNGVGTGQ